ncbi:uncharacterized protein TNCV_1920261 [Trichonephila clavipes]|nr:uncharacterized protein TNCV_1920261 [Trichonephila clavipes]
MLVRLSPGSCTIWRPETQNSAFLRYPLHGRFLQDPTSIVQRSSEVQHPAPSASFPKEQSVCVIILIVKKHQTQLHSTQSWPATGLRGKKRKIRISLRAALPTNQEVARSQRVGLVEVGLDTFFNFNSKNILVGDFYAKHTSWGYHCRDTRGNRLYNYIVKNSIDVLAPPTLTRFGINSASIIDYALIKNLNWPCTINSIPELSSDHIPIKLHFPRISKFELTPQLNTTWSKFTNNFVSTKNLYLHTASSTNEIEYQVRDLTSEILATHEKASKPVTHSEVPFVQGELKHLFKVRNRARKLWQFTRDPQHKAELNRLQNTIKRKVNLYRQQVWEDHLTSLNTGNGFLWGTAKAFRRKATPISVLNPPTGQHRFFRPTREASKTDHTEFFVRPGTHQK